MDRIDRVNEQLKREIGRIIQQELGDPRLTFVSVTKVQVSRDLRNAKVFFSVLGDSRTQEAAYQGLRNACGLIRRMVGQSVPMRYTPEIHFAYDKSIEYSAQIEKTLMDIQHGGQRDSAND